MDRIKLETPIAVRLPRRLLKALDARAASEFSSRSAVVRRALAAALGVSPQPQPPSESEARR